MKAKEVRGLTGEEIDVEVTRLRQRLYTLRCQASIEKLEKPSQIKKTRRDIARLLTERQARIQKQKAEA